MFQGIWLCLLLFRTFIVVSYSCYVSLEAESKCYVSLLCFENMVYLVLVVGKIFPSVLNLLISSSVAWILWFSLKVHLNVLSPSLLYAICNRSSLSLLYFLSVMNHVLS